MLKNLAMIGALTLLCTGCAQIQANARLKEFKEALDPMVGVATRERMAARYGIPDRQQQFGALEIWEYHKSFGVRGDSSGYGTVGPSGVSTFGQSSAREVYDSITLTFNAKGILQDWKVYVQR